LQLKIKGRIDAPKTTLAQLPLNPKMPNLVPWPEQNLFLDKADGPSLAQLHAQRIADIHTSATPGTSHEFSPFLEKEFNGVLTMRAVDLHGKPALA
jgi:hypothetical protein